MLPPAPEQRAQEGETPVSMASANGGEAHGDATAAADDGGDRGNGVKSIQSHYLRCPSPSNLSMLSESRFSMISGSDAESIFMEPIHLSSAIAAKQIINEELPSRGVQAQSVPESMLETPEQLMVEDLYNRVKDMIDDRSPYNTPCVLDIQRAMVQDRLESPINPVDEVWPSIFIAEKSVAVNKARLKRMGITHILNAAHGTGVYTGESFYAGMNIHYMGIEVDDFNDADISPHFRTTAEFLDDALLTHKGKVLVVSMMGVSRSAVLVASYLMIFQHMSIMEALTALRKKRPVNPNEGFLKQLRQLNKSLMEERDDDDDTLSQCSVIDARARARIFGPGAVEEDEEEEEEDTDEEEKRSMVGVKAHSIMMEEEEDGTSVMSSIASSAGALRSSYDVSERRRAEREPRSGEALPPVPLLPPGTEVQGGDEVVEEDDDDGVGGMVREWQRRNEKYQSEEWWQAQLDSDGEEDADSLPEPGSVRAGKGKAGDLESITSEDVRAVKERVRRRNRRPPSTSASATSGASTYADLWRQRLREIEEQAAARYRKREGGEDGEDGDAVVGADDGNISASDRRAKKKIDEDVESLLSDTSSMYTFCQRNKEKLTPLERWRVKRIQFGWNKKDGEEGGSPGGDGSSVAGGKGGEGAPPEARSTSLEEVNLTAYQNWKLKQQRRLGDENKDEILELSRGEDSATAKRRQRREELLERSRKTLEESQSMCGWETESSVSAGTIPLSAFWAGAGVTGPTSVANDDNVSMLSGRSSVISSVSQPRGARAGPHPVPSLPPMVPVPTMQGPGGEPMVNLASIQNWIANVVSETIMQKQNEMSLPPPSQAGSMLGFGGTPSLLSGRGGEFDKASLLSGMPYCSAPPLGRTTTTRAESVLSGGGLSRISGSSSVASKKTKITTTSVPLFSLFQDQVDLGKLDTMDKEMKSEMRDKMATYERKKILEDNKRSTLFKKKKPKEDEDEEEEEERKKKEEEFLKENIKKTEKPKRSYGLSGCLNLNPALEKDKNTSIDDWLKSVRPPPKKTTSSLDADGPATGVSVVEDPYDDLDGSASEFGFPGHVRNPGEGEEEYGITSSPNHPYRGARSQLDSEFSSNGFTQSYSYSRAARSYGERYEGAESYSTKRTLGNNRSDTGRVDRTEVGGNEEDEVSAFIAQTRQRIRARAAAEAEDDEVLVAWRAQQEAKSQSRNES